MSTAPIEPEARSPSVETHLLGKVDFLRCLDLQQRLIGDIGCRDDGQITLLLCEHHEMITIGRGGSPAEVLADRQMLRSRQTEIRWVNRGGGCLVHCGGQLAIYPMVPLRWHGFSVGEYLERLQTALVETLDDLGVRGQTPSAHYGIWGRSGQLAALGVAVRGWVTYYGAYLNVCPPMGLFRLVRTDSLHGTRMSSLLTERREAARMATVRSRLIPHIVAALGCGRYHLYTGHPQLRGGLAQRGAGS